MFRGLAYGFQIWRAVDFGFIKNVSPPNLNNARVEDLGVRLTNFRFGGLSLFVNSTLNARQI